MAFTARKMAKAKQEPTDPEETVNIIEVHERAIIPHPTKTDQVLLHREWNPVTGEEYYTFKLPGGSRKPTDETSLERVTKEIEFEVGVPIALTPLFVMEDWRIANNGKNRRCVMQIYKGKFENPNDAPKEKVLVEGFPKDGEGKATREFRYFTKKKLETTRKREMPPNEDEQRIQIFRGTYVAVDRFYKMGNKLMHRIRFIPETSDDDGNIIERINDATGASISNKVEIYLRRTKGGAEALVMTDWFWGIEPIGDVGNKTLGQIMDEFAGSTEQSCTSRLRKVVADSYLKYLPD